MIIITDLDVSEDEINESRLGFQRHKFLPKKAYQIGYCNIVIF